MNKQSGPFQLHEFVQDTPRVAELGLRTNHHEYFPDPCPTPQQDCNASSVDNHNDQSKTSTPWLATDVWDCIVIENPQLDTFILSFDSKIQQEHPSFEEFFEGFEGSQTLEFPFDPDRAEDHPAEVAQPMPINSQESQLTHEHNSAQAKNTRHELVLADIVDSNDSIASDETLIALLAGCAKGQELAGPCPSTSAAQLTCALPTRADPPPSTILSLPPAPASAMQSDAAIAFKLVLASCAGPLWADLSSDRSMFCTAPSACIQAIPQPGSSLSAGINWPSK
jgi:hypothetical protein